MSLDERLRSARERTVGVKQTTKAVQKGAALFVYVARDADATIVRELVDLCREREVPLEEVDAMRELGRACGIEVGAAAAAVVRVAGE